MRQRKTEPRVSRGILVLLVSLVALIALAAPMQNAWGMWGLALTELMLLVIALFFARRFGWELKDVFPLKIPSFRQILGVAVLWFASYLAVYVTTVTLYHIFPANMNEVSTALAEFFTSVPKPLALVIVAVLPGICEEVLHRGLIQYTFQGKSKWVTILGMALIFGLFHLDLYRFWGTALLGGALTYVMLETKNLVLPILLHVLNNAVSTSLAFAGETDGGLAYIPLSAVGAALVVATITPFLFVYGSRLLTSRKGEARRSVARRTWVLASLLSLLFLVGGVFFVVSGSVAPIFETSFSEIVAPDAAGHRLPFTVTRADNYRLDLTIEAEEGLLTSLVILRDDNEEVYSVGAGSITVQTVLQLAPGDYSFIVEYDHRGAENFAVEVTIQIQ